MSREGYRAIKLAVNNLASGQIIWQSTDTAVAWSNGRLSANQRQQAIAEFTKVLNIMQAPNARFNREPVERVRNGLATLRGVRS